MEWISMKDEPPMLQRRVLVYPNKEDIVISRLENDSELGIIWQDDDFNTFGIESVDYWMKLPSKPKDKKR